MATRTQGLFLGCLLIVATAAVLLLITFLFLPGMGYQHGLTLATEDSIGLVVLEGPITESRVLVDEIEAHRNDPSIRAVVVRIDSPGGDVAPSQEIYEALRRLSLEKPLIASVGGMAASGAFYAAVAADSIVADAGSVVGSIGAIFMYPTAREFMDKVGIDMQVYKSGRLKDMGSFARDPTEEEESIFDGIVADVFDQFVTAVATERGMDRDAVLSLSDGRIFTGRQARDLGLVDRLGDLYSALGQARTLAGLHPDAPVVRKTRTRFPFLELLDRLFRDNARTTMSPRLEYRLR